MNESTTRGLICLDSLGGIACEVCAISYTVREDETFEYVFEPNYEVIDLLGPPLFQGIPGLDLSLCRSHYLRPNKIPVFISERTPAKNREDLWQLLDQAGMEYLNQLEWLIRTDKRYIGDNFYVVRATSGKNRSKVLIEEVIASAQNSEQAMLLVLSALGRGDEVVSDGESLEPKARRALFTTFTQLVMKGRKYRETRKLEGIKKSSAAGRYAGRAALVLDDARLDEIIRNYKHGKLTAKVASQKLNISESTFYRRLRER